MAHERNKGQAGLGGRGKNQTKGRQDQATPSPRGRKKSNLTQARNKEVPGSPSGAPERRNQKKNQRDWHENKVRNVRKEQRTTAGQSA